jgi:uncharacterized alkaline shock family protein YloU
MTKQTLQRSDQMTAEAADKNVTPEAVTVLDTTIISDTDAGCATISKSVIAMIVRKYTLEVEGVSRFAPQRLVEGLADMLSKRNYERSIQIDFVDNEVTISLTVIANFGYPLPTVVKNIQSVVKEKVEEVVEIKVRKVNVFIKDLEEFAEVQPVDEALPSEA